MDRFNVLLPARDDRLSDPPNTHSTANSTPRTVRKFPWREFAQQFRGAFILPDLLLLIIDTGSPLSYLAGHAAIL
jgi:hypothetical protein